MREENAHLMVIQHAVENLPTEQKRQVESCILAIRSAMADYNAEDAGIALMLIAAEVAAE